MDLEESRRNSESIHFRARDQNETLGLVWVFREDKFRFKFSFLLVPKDIHNDQYCQKFLRYLIFLVWLNLLLCWQKLWQKRVNWDQSFPLNLEIEWRKLREEFLYLNNLKIPRHLVCEHATTVEIHEFSDATMTAYGGYL